jgi:carbamate kinase
MGPKIQAAIDFLEHRGEECIITSVESAAGAVIGNGGTHIVAPWRRTSLDFAKASTGAR